MRYIFILSILSFLLSSCGQNRGCTNEWGNNYDHEAIVDCCCEYDVEKIISDMVGTYEMKETCSGVESTYFVDVLANSVDEEGILITNFNNSGFDAKATWNADEFKLENRWSQNTCTVTLSGSVHKASGKLFFVYAAFPENTCDDTQGTTCEARSL